MNAMKVAIASAMVLGSGIASAALDTAVTTAIDGANDDVVALGALVFGIAVSVKLYKWLRRAL